MRRTTLGQILINRALPKDMRDHERVLDKGGIERLLQELAEKHPDRYRAVTKKLSDVGRDAAFTTGGQSFGLRSLLSPPSAKAARLRLIRGLRRIASDESLSPQEREQKIVELAQREQAALADKVFEEARAEGNPLVDQVESGSRGNKHNLNTLIGADLLYTNNAGESVPIPVLSSYSQGLRPSEYFAGSYGARKGIVDVKSATADAGFFAKQLLQAAHRLLVTDEEEDEPDEPGRPRGLPVDVDDADNEGTLLAKPVGGYERHTVLTPKILKDLKGQGIRKILVRSPLVGGPRDGGVYARDVGVREKGRLAPTGDYVGIAGAQALAEPISQAQLCLAEGTLVRMADWSTKPIEDIVPGDAVRGADKNGYTFPVHVSRVYHNGKRECVYTLFYEAKTKRYVELVSTKDHKLLAKAWHRDALTQYEVLPVSHACMGYAARAATYLYNPEVVQTAEYFHRQRQESVGDRQTYDLEVDHPDHLFVLANGLIVSNSSKHAGGVAGEATAGAVSGFAYLNQLAQVPKTFKGGAAHAQADGTVTRIEEAPQGGHWVHINSKKHYVGKDFPVRVKPGDKVEAGDVLSDGIPNPAEIVKHKGIGEGRRYFVDLFRKALEDVGAYGNRRNIELVGRGLINHVEMIEESGDYAPGDVVPYQALERAWQPRQGVRRVAPKQATGKYLERPVLHYSVGTPIRPSVVKQLEEHGIQDVDAHDDPPPFQPRMIRAMESAHHDPDWMTRLLGSYQQRSLLRGAQRGAVSDELGTSFVPALAETRHFGLRGKTKGWDPDDLGPTSVLD